MTATQPTPEKIQFLKDFKLTIEIERKSNLETKWKDRDEQWFREDARKLGMLKILNILFEE